MRKRDRYGLRILHLTNCYYTTPLYQSLLQALDSFDELSNTVAVPCIYDDPGKSTVYQTPREIKLPCFRKWDRFLFYRKQRLIYRALEKAIDISKNDLVHAHLLFSHGATALRIKHEKGVPYLATIRNTDVNTFFYLMPHLRSLGIRIMQEAERIVFLSSTYQDTVFTKYVPSAMREAFIGKSVILPNGIDSFWHSNRRLIPQVSFDDPLRLLFVGQICRQKNPLVTLRACKLLLKQGINVTYTVVGRPIDDAMVAALRRESFVKVLPPCTMTDLLPIYQAHHIFVMPSLTETFGLVYPEAMSQGLPIIYSESQGFDGQFPEGKVGYHVSPHSAEAVAGAILSILPQLHTMSAHCIEESKRFRWMDIATQYASMYHDICHTKHERE